MVRLTSITTKGGDGGQTSLGDGSRVSKHDARVASYGDVDELNALLGRVRAELLPDSGLDAQSLAELEEQFHVIQQQLFDLGADLSVPGEAGDRLRTPASYVERLEAWQNAWNERLEPLESFILPAGSRLVAALHHARAVCRRTERQVCFLRDLLNERGSERLNAQTLIYLNRLSDYLFITARIASGPSGEVLWTPGGGAGR